MLLIDTDIAIHWRDGDPDVRARIEAFDALPAISIITVIELENGVYRDPAETAVRRARLDAILHLLVVINFTEAEAAAYQRILRIAGYARRRTNDRMIAATAIAHGLTLVTMNGDDFRDIPGLSLEIWNSPARG